MFVETDDSTDHAAVTLEMTVPVGVGQHNAGRAVRAVFVRVMEEPAKIWFQS